MTTRAFYTVVCFLAFTALVAAQESPSSTQSFQFTDLELKSALAEVGKLYNVKVLSEEGLKGAVTAKATAVSIDAALSMITAPHGLAWREFVLAVKPTDEITAQTLDGLMDALDAIQFSGLVMQGPQLQSPMVVARAESAEGVVGQPPPEGSKYTRYYYVYNPVRKAEPPEAAVEKTRRASETASDPEQQMQQYRAWFNALDDATKLELVKWYMDESLKSGNPISAERTRVLDDGTVVHTRASFSDGSGSGEYVIDIDEDTGAVKIRRKGEGE